MRHFFSIIFIFSCTLAFAQRKPEGKFLEDSLVIGRPVQFALSYIHDNKSDLVFPDSNFNFSPFKLIEISYSPTKSVGSQSMDSVIYKLVTYHIDSTYKLSLPIYALNSKTKIYSKPSVIYFKSQLDTSALKDQALKQKLIFYPINQDFNLPKLLYFVLVLLLSSLIFYLIFGKIIRNQWELAKFIRKHKDFASAFKKLSKKPKNKQNISDGLILWKNHMENILRKPFSSMTTKEISFQLKNPRLTTALTEFDTAIYGGVVSDQMSFAFNILFEIASDSNKMALKAMKDKFKA